MSKNNKYFINQLLILVLVIFDQITKKLAVHFLSEKSITVIPGVFSFTLLEGGNSGAAFGLFKGGFWFFVISTAIVIFLASLFLLRMPETKRFNPLRFSVILLMAGAFGNLVDRISTKVETGSSFVVDFLSFDFIDFPIFNVADIYITFSALLMIMLGFFYYKDEDFNQLIKRENKDGK